MTSYILPKLYCPSWLPSIPLALMLTLSLLLLMGKLISTKHPEITITEPQLIPEVNWKKPKLEDVKIKRAEKVEPPEPNPPTQEIDKSFIKNLNSNFSTEYLPTEVPVGFDRGMDDRMSVAQVMVAPKYPSQALRKGIEGYVDVKFDITDAGRTINISVLAANPEGYFESAAIAAVSRWRYLPQVNQGLPVAVLNVSHRLRFEMGD